MNKNPHPSQAPGVQKLDAKFEMKTTRTAQYAADAANISLRPAFVKSIIAKLNSSTKATRTTRDAATAQELFETLRIYMTTIGAASKRQSTNVKIKLAIV